MTQLNIAILGAGIAGLCAAIALHQKGFKVTLFERNSKIKETNNTGAGLVLWPNACSILAKLQLLDTIKANGYNLDQMLRYTNSGEFLNAINFTANHADDSSSPGPQYKNYAITRKSLHDSFINKINKYGIEIRYNHKVNKIHTNSNQTTIVYFDNSKQITADIIIGADGRMNSIARKYVAGNNQAIYQGYVNWVGLIAAPSVITFENNILDYWGCGERFGIVPLSQHTAYWAGCKALPENLGEPESGNKNTLQMIFKDWPENINAIIKNSKQQHIKRIEVYDHQPLTSWHRDNVCLIGDAAHAALPTSGQGACQAIEDAYYLADHLSKLTKYNLDNYQSAFDNFYNQRFDVTHQISHNARQLTRTIFNTDPQFCRERDRKIRQH